MATGTKHAPAPRLPPLPGESAPGPRDWTGEVVGGARVEGLEGFVHLGREYMQRRTLWRLWCGCGSTIVRTVIQLQDARRKKTTLLCPACLAREASLRLTTKNPRARRSA
jgi:hypothetical protein